MSKTIEQLAKEHLKSTKSNGLAITYSLDELEDFAKAYQAQNEQQEVFNLEQILHDPEIQTLRAKVASADVLVEALREITYSHDGYARKKAEQALVTYDKLSEVKHDTK